LTKIAIPSRGGFVDEHFGHCESITIFTVDDDKAIVSESTLSPPSACGCKSNLIPILVESGVSVMLAGGMGQGAANRLGESGIQVVRGAAGPLRAALRDWLDGRMQDDGEVCHSHGDHACGDH
jgi:predicted Fe-Mo cluster-binding NifX family protein